MHNDLHLEAAACAISGHWHVQELEVRFRSMSAGAFLALVAARPALAAQCATVTFSPGSVSLPSYDPISGGAVQSSFTATISRTSAATRNVRLIFSDSANAVPVRLGSVGTTPGPSYEILDPGGNNVVFPSNTIVQAKTNPLIPVAAGLPGDSVQAALLLNVPANTAGRDLRNGVYVENLSYSISCFGDPPALIQSTDTRIPGPALSLTIPNLVSLTTASAETIDFQNFTTLTQQINVGLKSTGPINVELRTENNRRLVRLGAAAPVPTNSYIGYAINLNGRAVGPNPYILSNAKRAGVGGTQWPLQLSLPTQPSGKVAGTYRDTITLTLTPGN